MSSMSDEVHRIGIVAGKIVAMNVINVAIRVIVDPIPCNFAGVSPDVGGQVRVEIVNSAINNRNFRCRTSSEIIPCNIRIDVRIVDPCDTVDQLCGVPQAPHATKVRVVWHCCPFTDPVRFG